MKIILLFLILALTPYSVFAAQLVDDDGKIKFHDQEFVPATFVFRSKKNGDELSYKIEMIHDERPYKFEKLTFDGKQMMFVLDTGLEYNCVLSFDEKVKKDIKDCKDREGYCGECIHLADDEKQKLIIINMKLPPKEPEPPVQDNADK